jgi:hypothetical protein
MIQLFYLSAGSAIIINSNLCPTFFARDSDTYRYIIPVPTIHLKIIMRLVLYYHSTILHDTTILFVLRLRMFSGAHLSFSILLVGVVAQVI